MDESPPDKSNDTITNVGYLTLFIYCIIKILSYYGVSPSIYAPYLAFYIFLLFCKLALLPTSYDDFDMKTPVSSDE